MSLAESFTRSLPPELADRFPDPEEALGRIITTAREAWPAIDLDETAFLEHLAQRLTADTTLATLHAADLWLAFACVLGDPTALSAFDQAVLARVPSVLKGNLPAGLSVDEVLQSLRLKLFVRQSDAPPAIATYSGRGALLHWVRAAAVRLTQDHARARKLEHVTDDEALLDTPVLSTGAELNFLKNRFAPDFKAAFQEALKTLSTRDQNLLRLYYLEGSSPEEIGRVYQTHRTTVWRWLTQCREALLTQTRAMLAARTKVSDAEVSSLMNAVHSQLDLSLSRMLKKP